MTEILLKGRKVANRPTVLGGDMCIRNKSAPAVSAMARTCVSIFIRWGSQRKCTTTMWSDLHVVIERECGQFYHVKGGATSLSVPGRPTIWIIVGQGRTALAVGVGGGCLDIFTLTYPFSPLSPSLLEPVRY